MTTANDAERTPADGDGARTGNGATSLRDRVRSLRLSGGAPPAPRRSLPAVLLPWGLCVILLIVAVALGVRAAGVGPAKEVPAGPAVTGETASSGDVALEAKGYIVPVHQIQVSPKVAGMLVWIDPRLEEGQVFKEGDVLARIEDDLYSEDYDRACGAWTAATGAVDQAKANLVSAQQALHTRQDLLQRDLNSRSATTESDRVKDQDDVNYQQAVVKGLECAVRVAEANENTAAADLGKAKLNLLYCQILAPVTGTILKKSAEKGNIVNPIAFNISASLCDMADLSDLEVDLKIQERDIAKVHKGQACIAMPEAYENDPDFLKVHPKGYTGVVSRLMPTADRGQGAIPVRVKLDIPKDEEGVFLKPDMGVSVEFLKK